VKLEEPQRRRPLDLSHKINHAGRDSAQLRVYTGTRCDSAQVLSELIGLLDVGIPDRVNEAPGSWAPQRPYVSRDLLCGLGGEVARVGGVFLVLLKRPGGGRESRCGFRSALDVQ
jgi:hypothetical protein